MSEKPLDLPTLTHYIKNCKGFDRVIEKVKITAFGDGKCTAELKIDETHLNAMGGLHGGFSATLVDDISTFALMSQTKTPGVSVDIHVSYVKGAKAGDEIIIEGKVLKTGLNVVFLEVEIKNKATGDILAKGSQTQFLVS